MNGDDLDALVPDWPSVRQIMRRGRMKPEDREHLLDDELNEPTELEKAWRDFVGEARTAALADWKKIKALFKRSPWTP